MRRSYTRETKLKVLTFWQLARIEDNSQLRALYRKEVSAYFLIPETNISEWRQQEDRIVNMQKGDRWALKSLDVTGHVKWPLLEAVRVGLSLPIDGSCDHELSVKICLPTFYKLEIGHRT